MTIMFNKWFMNAAGNDLIEGKIHTIRRNYEWWKKHDGEVCSLRVWEGKPYHSKQIEVCKKEIHVEKLYFDGQFTVADTVLDTHIMAKNDGFETEEEFYNWFIDYPCGDMAILHFTDFRYGGKA